MMRLKAFLALVGIMFCSIDFKAQEDLSLSDAIQVGLSQNYDIQLTQKNIEINRIQNVWGQAGRYPTITINATQGNNIADQSNNPTSFIQELLMSNSIQGGANLNWTLFNGFRVKANKEKLEQLERQSEGMAALVVENTIQGIVLSYYSAKVQSEKVLMLKTVLELTKQKYEYQKIKKELGAAVTVDLLQFESAFYTDSSNFLMQELAYDNAIRNLNLLMGVPEDQTWKLTDDITIENEEYRLQDLKNKMLSNNQNIKNEYVNLEILDRDITLAKATMYPVVGFQAGAQTNLSSFKIADFPRAAGTTLNYYANFTLNFTIFDGGKVRRGIQALKVQNEVNEIQINQLKDRLSSELKGLYDLYEVQKKSYELLKLGFSVAKDNLEIARLKENSGLINSFVVRDIEMAYLTTGISLIESGYNLIATRTNIAKLTGGLLEE